MNKFLHTCKERLHQYFYRHPQNRTDLVRILREAHHHEILNGDVLGMLEGVLYISKMRVGDIMIPRSQMSVIERNATLAQVLPMVIRSAHSRFPVIGENRDEVVGILLAKDLLRWTATHTDNDPFNIRALLRPATFIPESKRLDSLLNEFRKNRNHLAIVVDEYGGITGLVTIEDVLEQIVGDISDEYDNNEDIGNVLTHEDGRCTVKATMSIVEFNRYFHADFDESEADTIGGLVLKKFGRLPEADDSIEAHGYRFTVLRADHRRLHLLYVSCLMGNNAAS